ncbi:DNA replication and repair protein RecF [bacterium]|nr:DNA replication and repair protein RecF [bacterium]
MQLKRIEVKNFRCFTTKTVQLDNKIVVLKGLNGAGKSSLIEALHYLCYLRSFRATSVRDLIRFGQEGFFVKAHFLASSDEMIDYSLQVGFANKKRLVKLNNKVISSFKELMDHYRVVTLTEDDLALIKSGPDVRRQFIDQAILLQDQGYTQRLRTFKKILQNRNSLLQSRNCCEQSCHLWTTQLWEASQSIQKQRVAQLKIYQESVNHMLFEIFNESIIVNLEYRPKNGDLTDNFKAFMARYTDKQLFLEEMRYRRSLFGCHLDDIVVTFQGKKSKQFASRGQQKLTILLLKIAQLRAIEKQRGPAVLLLDDFMTDFDEEKIQHLCSFFASLPYQLIFTSPAQNATFDHQIKQLGGVFVNLTV